MMLIDTIFGPLGMVLTPTLSFHAQNYLFSFFLPIIKKNFLRKLKKLKIIDNSVTDFSEKKERKKKINYTYNLILNHIIQYLLVSLKEKRSIRLMHATIKKHGCISPSQLQKECGNMSISTFNKLKPYLMEEYEGNIEYVRQRKLFVDLNPDDRMGLAIQEVLEKSFTNE